MSYFKDNVYFHEKPEAINKEMLEALIGCVKYMKEQSAFMSHKEDVEAFEFAEKVILKVTDKPRRD